jgi:uncharacterized surface protein with fasciclin (FAS1) repeats
MDRNDLTEKRFFRAPCPVHVTGEDVMRKSLGIAGFAVLAVTGIASAQTETGTTTPPPGEEMPAPNRDEPMPTPPAEPAPGPAPSGSPAPDQGAAPTAAPDATPIATDGSQTVAANVVAADRLSTLESAVVAANLAEPLGGSGPFTVFAPDNAAFTLVRPEALQALMQPANRAQLENVLKAHVVAGRVTAAELGAQIDAGNGTATLETIGGDRLTATREGQSIVITGAHNSRAYVTQADANASNGVIHIVNGVLLPAD